MINPTKPLKLKCEKSEIYFIEQFVEDISNKLYINETYFGNILTSLTLLFNYLIENQRSEIIYIDYFTDYKSVKLTLSDINETIIKSLLQKIELPDTDTDETQKSIFLIQSLTDNLSPFEYENKLTLVYDISAVHDKVYNSRKQLLENYFKNEKNIKLANKQ